MACVTGGLQLHLLVQIYPHLLAQTVPPVLCSLPRHLPLTPPNSRPTLCLQCASHPKPPQPQPTITLINHPHSKKLGTPVPRLDLTPVLATLASEQQQDSAASPSSGAHNHQGHHPLLLLEDAPKPRRLELDGDAGEGGCGDDDYDDFEAQFGE